MKLSTLLFCVGIAELIVFVTLMCAICPAKTGQAQIAGMIVMGICLTLMTITFGRQLKAEKEEALCLLAA